MIEDIISVWHQGMYIDPQTLRVLNELKTRCKIALITNWEYTPRIYMLLDKLGLDGFFDEVIISDEVGVSKPDPRILHIALKRTGLEAEEVAYVGDGEVDVVCSRNAGVKPILIKRPKYSGNWFYGLRYSDNNLKRDCVAVIESLDELLNLY
jgi:putative hydrolase of the HAD superfamily